MSRTRYYSIRMKSARNGVHISGAEGIYEKGDVIKMVQKYTNRSFIHEKGRADEVRLIVEELRERPIRIPSLPLCTINTRNADAAKKAASQVLSSVGITERAIDESFRSLTMGIIMRGAMLLDIEGVRLEPDLLRGVRVTRIGITKEASATMSRRLGGLGLNNHTVKEALILASKVHRNPMVLAELCISDDPGYTTGYVATRSHGYIRLPRIKKRGAAFGGRAFFITGGEVKDLIKYLQTTPVLVNRIMPCKGLVTLKEIIGRKSRS
jgi:6-carboxyhexanoate--CoA ligase